MVVLRTPTRARLLGYEDKKAVLTQALTYTDKRVEFELKKTSDSIRRWEGRSGTAIKASLGETLFEERLAEMKARRDALKAQRKKCLLFEDEEGLWTYSGLAHKIAKEGNDQVSVEYALPEPEPLPWANHPEHSDRPYQTEAHDLMLDAVVFGPCGVELATGAGKGRVILNLVKSLGLGAVVMAPSTSIAGQLYGDLVHAFGKRYVGLFGNGKKQFDKLIVVGIDDSLTRVKEGSEEWECLSSKKVFIADESHLCPADTLAKVCFGLMADAPYRFFFSATQLRQDGLDVVLDGIVGRIVMRKTVRELVDEGYLAKPTFKMVKIGTNSNYKSSDPNTMTRKHLYYNPQVYRTAADLANKFVSVMQRPVVILVEELEQYAALKTHFKHASKFAHGPLNKDNKQLVPEECWKDDPADLVAAFNEGKFPILVGTSCISTGTDIKVAEAAIYLQGGKSEIKVRQGVGRETRGGVKGHVFNPWTGKQKLNCVHVDFDVVDMFGDEGFAPHRHALERAKLYEEIYGPVQYLDMREKD